MWQTRKQKEAEKRAKVKTNQEPAPISLLLPLLKVSNYLRIVSSNDEQAFRICRICHIKAITLENSKCCLLYFRDLLYSIKCPILLI